MGPFTLRAWALTVLLAIALASCAPAALPTVTPLPSATNAPTATSTVRATALPASPNAAPTLTYQTPDWFKHAVLYEVYVRSFYDSDGNGIGDLQGVRQKLDYIEQLHVNVIWLMPINPSPSVHGYDVTDYFGVNPDYGTLQDLQALVADAHQRNIKVVLDLVPSHASEKHPYFVDAYANLESSYKDWFMWTNEQHTRYASFADLGTMPRFNHKNQAVVDYFGEITRFWLDLDSDGDYSDGIDGFRVDNVTFPPHEFHQALRQIVKSANPNALWLGEAWTTKTGDLGSYFLNQYDALFDFPLYGVVSGSHDINGDGSLQGKSLLSPIGYTLREAAEIYPPQAIPVRFLDNHDTNRTASELSGNVALEKLSAAFLTALPGSVLLYYGDEIGMLGEKGKAPYYDAYRRAPLEWFAAGGTGQTTWFDQPDDGNQPSDGISVAEQTDAPDSLLNTYREFLQLRATEPALQTLDFVTPKVKSASSQVWVMARGNAESGQLLWVFNFGDTEQTATVSELPFATAQFVDIRTGDVLAGGQAGAAWDVTVPAQQVLVLRAQP